MNTDDNNTFPPIQPNADPAATISPATVIKSPQPSPAPCPDEIQSLFGPTIDCPIARLTPDQNQPRRSFPEDELQQLTQTIRTHGILEPILAMPGNGNMLVILVGERRWRAAPFAGLTEVPVRILTRQLEEANALEFQLIENSARQDVPTLELAAALNRLKLLRPRPLKQIAATIGLHVSSVSRLLTLLRLPEPIRAMIDKKLSPAVAGEIAKVKAECDQLALAEKAARDHLSREQTAALVARCNADHKAPPTPKKKPSARVILHLEQPAVDVAVSAIDSRPITMETILAALEATAKRCAHRLFSGAGTLDDLIDCFAKKNNAHKPPTGTAQNGSTRNTPPSSPPAIATKEGGHE